MYYVTIDMPNICGQELLLLFNASLGYSHFTIVSVEMSNCHFVIKMYFATIQLVQKYSHMCNTVVPYICHSVIYLLDISHSESPRKTDYRTPDYETPDYMTPIHGATVHGETTILGVQYNKSMGTSEAVHGDI